MFSSTKFALVSLAALAAAPVLAQFTIATVANPLSGAETSDANGVQQAQPSSTGTVNSLDLIPTQPPSVPFTLTVALETSTGTTPFVPTVVTGNATAPSGTPTTMPTNTQSLTASSSRASGNMSTPVYDSKPTTSSPSVARNGTWLTSAPSASGSALPAASAAVGKAEFSRTFFGVVYLFAAFAASP